MIKFTHTVTCHQDGVLVARHDTTEELNGYPYLDPAKLEVLSFEVMVTARRNLRDLVNEQFLREYPGSIIVEMPNKRFDPPKTD